MAVEQGTSILFKYGEQANYDKITTKDAGTFYVTSDTNRLYLGDQLLSQAVKAVSELPTTNIAIGQIYLLTSSNVLCYYTGSEWKQLNPDTYVSAASLEAEAVTGGAKLAFEVDQNGKTAIKDDVTFKGTNGITVSRTDAANIEIAAPELGGKTEGTGAAITLASNEVKVNGGTDISVSYDATNGITIASTATEKYVSSGALSFDNAATGKTGFVVGGELNVENGTKVTLTTDSVDPVIKLDSTATVNSNNQYKYSAGVATLPIYTKAEIDSKVQTALDSVNAMTYKGLVDNLTANASATTFTLPSSGVKVGDTYMLGQAKTVNVNGTAAAYQAGTIFIATGTETNGVIADNGVTWNCVQTSDHDTTYELDVDSGKVVLYNKSTKTNNGTITFAPSSDAKVTLATTASGNNVTVTATHATPSYAATDVVTTESAGTVSQTAGGSDKVTVLTGVARDATGHVTKVSTKEITLVDTNLKAATIEASQTTTDKKVTLKTTIQDDSTSVNASQTIESETLKVDAVTSGTNGVKLNLVWGTF